MSLSEYHQQQANLPQEKFLDKVQAKVDELELILRTIPFTPPNPAKVAILGCADKRYIPFHQQMFETQLHVAVEMVTFDIVIDHLAGVPGVVQHDCTLPIPQGPFDLTYGHVVLKFIEPERQWLLIKNSWDVLRAGGLAIHVIDTEDIQNGEVALDKLKKQLGLEQIDFQEIKIKYGVALVLRK